MRQDKGKHFNVTETAYPYCLSKITSLSIYFTKERSKGDFPSAYQKFVD